jgi:hypothetical protein
MFDFLIKFLLVVRSRLKTRARLEAEILVLRQQVVVLIRRESLDHLVVFGEAHLRDVLKDLCSLRQQSSGRISPWIEMLRIFALPRRSGASQRFQSSAGSIINTFGFRF